MSEAQTDTAAERVKELERLIDEAWAPVPLDAKARFMMRHHDGLDPVRLALREVDALRAQVEARTADVVTLGEQRDTARNEVTNLRAQVVEKDAEIASLREEKHGAYAERNRLVAALSRLWPSHLARHPEDDATWDREWMTIVCIHSPAGQLTWHVKDDERGLFAHLSDGVNHWDGHTTDEKYRRLARV